MSNHHSTQSFKKQTLRFDLSLGDTDHFERSHDMKEYLEWANQSETRKSQHILTGKYSADMIFSCQVNGPILFNEMYHPHPLVMCCSRAYSDHYGLILSPDDIWLLIAQGFSRHVEMNSKEFRHLFISDDCWVENKKDSDDKIKILVFLEKYMGGNGLNSIYKDINWQGVIDEIIDQIDSNVKKNIIQMLECNFSTTGPVEKVSSRVVIMSGFKNYFSYWNGFRCGLPSITLLGNLEDWTKLKEKTLELNGYGLELWTRALIPILDNFIETYSCSEPLPQRLIDFWNSISRHFNMSGGKKVDGWINYFFPFNKNGSVKSYLETFDLENFRKGKYQVDSCSNFTTGLSKVKVNLVNSPIQNINSLDYMAGFLGYDYDEQIGGLKPRMGWAIAKSSD